MNTNKPNHIQQQSIGIDVSSETLNVRVGTRTTSNRYSYTACKTFRNTPEGFTGLLEWVQLHAEVQHIWFIMEATGVYYEELAYFLRQQGQKVCVLVARRAGHFAKSLPVKSKTDAIDARLLARYGLERQPRPWEPGSGLLRKIKILLRERHQLKKQRTQLKNRLHAAQRAWQHPPSSMRRLTDHIEQINSYLKQINEQLDQLWQSDQQLAAPLRRMATISGLTCLSILKVVAETNGFALVNNRNQLASYAGMDVVFDQSGNRKGSTRISKQGNVHIRRALYMPALAASQHNKALRTFYERLVDKHPDKKKRALTAVMRKLLLLIYSLWKSGQEYDPEFHYRQIIKTA